MSDDWTWCEATGDWTVGIVAETADGEVLLHMTEAQAERLCDRLVFLMGDDDA